MYSSFRTDSSNASSSHRNYPVATAAAQRRRELYSKYYESDDVNNGTSSIDNTTSLNGNITSNNLSTTLGYRARSSSINNINLTSTPSTNNAVKFSHSSYASNAIADFSLLSARLREKLRSTEDGSGSMSKQQQNISYTNGGNGDATQQRYTFTPNLRREPSDCSTINNNSDLESIAPQSSVYSADLKGSNMTLNSDFTAQSNNSSVANTPLHFQMSTAGGASDGKQSSKLMQYESTGQTDAIGLQQLHLQIRRKFVRDSFRLNIMVVGATGLGKSTFINTLFNSTIYEICDGDVENSPDQNEPKESPSFLLESTHSRWKKHLKELKEKELLQQKELKTKSPKSTRNINTSSFSSKLLASTTRSALAQDNTSTSDSKDQSAYNSSQLHQWSVNDFQCLVSEGDATMTLGLIDTPGFAHFLDNSKCVEPLVNYINKQFDNYMTIESQIDKCSLSKTSSSKTTEDKENSKPGALLSSTSSTNKTTAVASSNNSKREGKAVNTRLQDPRVHCCLYFLSPQNPNRLLSSDIEAMRGLGDKVNLIPVIAKADTLTVDELKDFKAMVSSQLATHNIKVYEIPELTALQKKQDPELQIENVKYKSLVPFAVCGSNYKNEDGQRIRKYPFGVVEIENESHCDFVALRSILMQIHPWNLIDSTAKNHFEKYRSNKLTSSISGGGVSNSNTNASLAAKTLLGSTGSGAAAAISKGPLAILNEEKKAHEERLAKMRDDMQKVFEQKVAEKERRLKVLEDDMMRKHEEMRRNLEAQQAALAAAREQHEKNLKAWTESTAAALAASNNSVANQNSATLPANHGDADGTYGTIKDKKKKSIFGR